MSAAGPVSMAGADVVWRAMHRVSSVHCYRVLVDMISVHVMEMAVVKIVNVVSVLHGRVPTCWSVLMGVIGVFLFSASCHGCASLMSACPPRPLITSARNAHCGYLQ